MPYPYLTGASLSSRDHALNLFRPLANLLFKILRPVLDRSRLRNPDRRFLINRDGRFMFMYRRGPHRIWEARPHSAGLEVMDVLGTMSAAAAEASALSVVVVGWSKLVVIVVGLLLKMEEVVGEEAVLGRRRGREEKDLVYLSDKYNRR